MSRQSEAILEKNLIKQLIDLGYASAKVMDGDALVSNLKSQLEAFNKAVYTDKEFVGILNHLAKGNVFQKAKTLRDRFSFTQENGEIAYVRFFDSENWSNNLFQVTNQVSQEGSFKNRYDVTLLAYGMPNWAADEKLGAAAKFFGIISVLFTLTQLYQIFISHSAPGNVMDWISTVITVLFGIGFFMKSSTKIS